MAGGAYMDWEGMFKDEDVQRMLSKMIADGRNLRPFFMKVGAMMFGSIKETFRQQGRPVRWKGLAPLTIALRRKGSASGKPRILRDTGHLFTSVTSPHARDSILKTLPTKLVLGTRREGAVHHQKGRPAHQETWQVKAHTRRPYVRTDGIKVKQAQVRAHSKVMNFGRTPKRVFLQWRRDDIEKVKRILLDELTGGAGVLAKLPTGPGVLTGRA